MTARIVATLTLMVLVTCGHCFAQQAVPLPDNPVVSWADPADEPHAFDGASTVVTLPDAHEQYDAARGFTLSVWIRPEGFSSLAGIVGHYRSSRDGAWYLSLSQREPHRGLRVVMIDETPYPEGYNSFEAEWLLIPGSWHHVILTFDGEAAQLVCDGRLVASRKLKAPLMVPDATPLEIGKRSRDAFFEGQIRDLRIYDHAIDLSGILTGENFIRNASFEEGETLADILFWHRMADTQYLVDEQSAWELQRGGAFHGEQCLRGDGSRSLHLPAEVWQRIPRADSWTLSVYLRAERDGVPCEIRVGSYLTLSQETRAEQVTVGTEWQRYELTVSDFHANRRRSGGAMQGPMNFWIVPQEEATIWVDAVQWEPGEHAMRFAVSPRDEVLAADEFKLLTVPDMPDHQPVRALAGQTPGEVPLLVQHFGGEPVTSAPVTLGVPFPRGLWNGRGSLRLMNGNRELPVQSEIISQWRTDGSLQSLGLHFQADLQPGANQLTLHYDPEAGGQVDVADGSLLNRDSPRLWRAEVGGLVIEIDPDGGAIWESIADAATGEPLLSAAVLHATGMNGTHYSSLHAPEIVTEVESDGPLHLSIARRGLLTSTEGEPLLMFIARLHLWRDQPGAHLELTLVNSRAQDSVALRELWWETGALGAAPAQVRLPWRLAEPGDGEIALLAYRDEEAREFIRAEVRDGRLAEVRDGEREETWLGVERPEVTWLLHTRYGWQQHPTMLGADSAGTLRAYMWPARPVMGLDFSRGMSITRDFTLLRADAGDAGAARASAMELAGNPPVAMTTPEWFAQADLLVPVYHSDPERFPFMEERLTAHERLARLSPEEIEARNTYGLFNYGDHHGDGGWANLESFSDFSTLLMGLRNGDPVILRQGLVSARHYRDMDINQVVGACITHNPNHVMGGHSFSHAWPQGVFAHYLLTGSRRSLEVSLRVGEHMLALADMETGNRTLGRFLINLTDIYQVTADRRYLDRFLAQLDFAGKLLDQHEDIAYPSVFGIRETLVPYHGWYGCTALLKMYQESGAEAILPHLHREVPVTLDMGLYGLDLEQLWPGVTPEEGWPIIASDFARHRGNVLYPVLTGYASLGDDPHLAEDAWLSLYVGAVKGRAVSSPQAVLASAALSAVPDGMAEGQLIARAQDLLWRAAAPTLLNGDFTLSGENWEHWRPFPGKSLAHHDTWQDTRRELCALDSEQFRTAAPSMRFDLTTGHNYGRGISMDSARFQIAPGAYRLSGWVRSDENVTIRAPQLFVAPLDGRYDLLTFSVPVEGGEVEAVNHSVLEIISCSTTAPDAAGWRQWSIEFRAPQRAVATLHVGASLSSGRAGHAWFDDMQLEEL